MTATTAAAPAQWAQALAAACALESRPADASQLCACAEALRETTGAEIYPAETLIKERFLAPVLAEAGFAAELETARALSPDELIATAVAAAGDRRPAQTVASPVPPQSAS